MEPGGFVTVTVGVGGFADNATTAGVGEVSAAADGFCAGVDGEEEGLRRAFPQAAGGDAAAVTFRAS